mmetsp:Transcript_13041/g.20454  ORF Transcript_13041/g.20454 Transcript_13041/m.20454 type:complete len:98 (+) Transcript_13041:36-329(+)
MFFALSMFLVAMPCLTNLCDTSPQSLPETPQPKGKICHVDTGMGTGKMHSNPVRYLVSVLTPANNFVVMSAHRQADDVHVCDKTVSNVLKRCHQTTP